jgi:phospholipase C
MGIEDVKHVVILMQENRSFDEYFGTFPGATGFFDSPTVFANQWPGVPLPFRLSTFTTAAEEYAGSAHDWTSLHAVYNNGMLNNWNAPAGNTEQVLGYYVADDIPYHWTLAQNFALCDHYFCSVLGATTPNRLYLMSGAICDINADPAAGSPGPETGNPDVSPNYLCGAVPLADFEDLSWPSYPDLLEAAGQHSWKIYDETCAQLPWLVDAPSPTNGWGDLNLLRQFHNWPIYQGSNHIQTIQGQFEEDAQAGTLPTVSWIIPPFGATEWHKNHPADGAYYIAMKLDALLNGPLWDSTVFILTYDESDGHFDHVVPLVASADAAPPEQPVDGEPIGGGFRVPAIIISPWTVGVGVQTEPFDHTSILQFLEKVTNVVVPNLPTGGFRRQTFGDLTSVFDFTNPVGVAQVLSLLPSPSTVLQWKNNAQNRLNAQNVVVAVSPTNPVPLSQATQACSSNEPSFSRGAVLVELGREQSHQVPQPGGAGTATMANALIVTVMGFEPDEFIDLNAGVPPGVPALQVQPTVNGVPLTQPSRVPVVSVDSGAGQAEFIFTCTQMSADPAVLAQTARANNDLGVPTQITFWFSVTFTNPIDSFAFRAGIDRILDLAISLTVDVTITGSAQMVLTGGNQLVIPLDACAQLAEQITQAEKTLLAAQSGALGSATGNRELISAAKALLTALQNQYNQYCSSGGSSGRSGSSGGIYLGGLRGGGD